MRGIGKWLLRAMLLLAVLALAAYAVDWSVYRLRGSPHSSVVVSRFLAVPLKGQKTEYDYLGAADVSCAVALFSQDSSAPCWYLQRHARQWEDLGTPQY